MSEPRLLADTLCRDHLAVMPGTDVRLGTELALLSQLSAAVGSSSGRGSARGGGGQGSVINAAALELERIIAAHVHLGLLEWGGVACAAVQGTLTQRAGWWLYGVPLGTYATLEPTLAGWEHRIRTLLDPPQQVPLRGVACAHCEHTHVLLPDAYGVEVQAPAVLVTLRAGVVDGECRVCGATYDARSLHLMSDEA